MSILKVVAVVAVSWLLVVSLHGCGGNPTPAPTPAPTPTPAPPAPRPTPVPTPRPTAARPNWKKHPGLNCYQSHGAESVPSGLEGSELTTTDCIRACLSVAGCTAVVMDDIATESNPGKCFTRMLVYIDSCVHNSPYDMYINADAPPPPPTPAPTPPPGFCNDAACCKEKSQHPEDGQLCDEFYDESVGIGFSMLSKEVWAAPCKEKDLINGMDCALFHDESPNVPEKFSQALTLTHFARGICPWQGYGAQHGVVMRLGEKSGFWRYFATCDFGQGEVLAAVAGDGFRCNPRNVLKNLTYGQFSSQKNEIVAATGDGSWNEFDTNGLSSSALAGAIRIATWTQRFPPIPDSDLCRKLTASNKKRTSPWPVYAFQYSGGSSTLKIESYLNCDIRAKDEVTIV